jgi:hypothetical protein
MPSSRTEGLTSIDGVSCYFIPDVDRMDPFLVSVVSPGDLWIYASSAGGVAMGRVNAEGSVVPYRTVDLLHRVAPYSGAYTAIRVGDELWEPFTGRPAPGARLHLARSTAGDRLLFEAEHERLGLTVRAWWGFSDTSGIVRRVVLTRTGDGGAVEVMDGVRDLVPANAGVGAMQSMSCLVYAYTRAELVGDDGLAVVAMESGFTDRAEPAESLTATVAWGTGLPRARIHLDATAGEAFARGNEPAPVRRLLGRNAAYLRAVTVDLPPGESVEWATVLDAERRQAEVAAIRDRLAGGDVHAALLAEVDASSAAMDVLSAETDGLQCTGDAVSDAHHRTNTLFNDMRGGIPLDRQLLPWGDWAEFVAERNAAAAERHAAWLAGRPAAERIDRATLLAEVEAQGDPTLDRLGLEYLPFWFGRRHGDPSRPWNEFNIRIRDDEGHRRLFYEGNWRDIFQNWEALVQAHPGWLDSMVAKFVNATTADGFNAYRITRDGIDWEEPEPDNPWSNLGYWGDHQITYLNRLLEASWAVDPARLRGWLRRPIFSSADVPYRIADYAAMLADPRNTITFDEDANEAAHARAAGGSDGRLVADADGVVHVGFAEKLLIPVLAKLCAFVPEGGVWMNTQRPEWNDANNALAGFGLSMVTASYLRRHLVLLAELLDDGESFAFSQATADWLGSVLAVLTEHRSLLDGAIGDADRRRVLDGLGAAFDGRQAATFGAPTADVPVADAVALCRMGIAWLDHAIAANRRPDGLWHGYNLLVVGEGTAGIARLPEMLEGQVAVLSAGSLSAEQAADVVDALFASRLHRPELDTFLLQPVVEIPPLLAKGVLAAGDLAAHPLLQSLLEAGDRRLVERDAAGVVRFAADFVNGRDVEAALDELAAEPAWTDAVAAERAAVLATYERVFNHHAFTGRSGGMYGYEGIGCTYWHMVAKLLVAVGECARDATGPAAERLAAAYARVRGGLGFRMDARTFGALPIDAYSHSDGRGQARQPGMTGQVKEELLTRRMELGVRWREGCLSFEPADLLDAGEWLTAPRTWALPAHGDRAATSLELPTGSLGFQCCGVPVVYRKGGAGIRVHGDGGAHAFEGTTLDAATSARVAAGGAGIDWIEVGVG